MSCKLNTIAPKRSYVVSPGSNLKRWRNLEIVDEGCEGVRHGRTGQRVADADEHVDDAVIVDLHRVRCMQSTRNAFDNVKTRFLLRLKV